MVAASRGYAEVVGLLIDAGAHRRLSTVCVLVLGTVGSCGMVL
jgi:hypothetical protein